MLVLWTVKSRCFRRLVFWLDSNGDFYGSYENVDSQLAGQVCWPTLE